MAGPAFPPVINPVFKPILAADVLLLLHVPPVIPGLTPNVVVDAPHTMNEVVPVITGITLSVTTWVALQPAPGVV